MHYKFPGIDIIIDEHNIYEAPSTLMRTISMNLNEESTTNADDLEAQEYFTTIKETAKSDDQHDEENNEGDKSNTIEIDYEEIMAAMKVNLMIFMK